VAFHASHGKPFRTRWFYVGTDHPTEQARWSNGPEQLCGSVRHLFVLLAAQSSVLLLFRLWHVGVVWLNTESCHKCSTDCRKVCQWSCHKCSRESHKFCQLCYQTFYVYCNIFSKSYSSFVKHDHFVHSKTFCWIVVVVLYPFVPLGTHGMWEASRSDSAARHSRFAAFSCFLQHGPFPDLLRSYSISGSLRVSI